MNHLYFAVICIAFLLAGCTTNSSNYSAPSRELRDAKKPVDVFNALTPAELERVRDDVEHLQPYTRLKDFTARWAFADRLIPTSAWGPSDCQTISMQLRSRDILLLVRDSRGYVVAAQLGETKWQWPNYTKP
ncbi:MAG: hypothetical protein ACXWDN_10380 [Limisphaerales bacterium]